MITQIILFAETGALPALLVPMTSSFKLSFAEQGYLGGIVYLGIALGAPFTSLLTKVMIPRTVLVLSMAVNLVLVVLFASSPQGNTKYLIVLRFLIGVTQATVSVFCPVWVDRFAPKESQASWFSYLQISVPAGILVGYILGWGAIMWQDLYNSDPTIGCGGLACWRWPFLVQALATVPLCVLIQSLNSDLFDIEDRKGKVGDNDFDEKNDVGCCTKIVQYFQDIFFIMSHFYFTVTVLIITTIYFLLMSIQYWGTDYMVVGRGYNEHRVMGWFIFSCATGPVFGSILGGMIVDCMGGYRGNITQRTKIVGFLTISLSIGVFCALISTTNPKAGLLWVLCCLWCVLFFGGLAMPALGGMYAASIPSAKLKILGSAIQLVLVSVFAYFCCPVLAGHLMRRMEKQMVSCTNSKPGTCPEALEEGFRATLYSGPVGIFFCCIMLFGGLSLKGDRMMGEDQGKSGDRGEGEPLLKDGAGVVGPKML
jgi:hypothetical protein